MRNFPIFSDVMNRRVGLVSFIGASSDDPELLTLKAQRKLQEADVIVHDRVIAPVLLEGTRREAVRVAVDGRLFDGATDVLIREAKAGKRVVRMSCAEPSLEETISVAAEGLAFETVPGVSAPRLTGTSAFPVNDDFRDIILRAAS